MDLFVKVAAPALVALGAAWVLVQPDTPPPVVVQDEAATAVELLGETWDDGNPAPIARDPVTASEFAAAREMVGQSAYVSPVEVGPVFLPDAPNYDAAQVLRRPMPRPVEILPAAADYAVAAPGEARPADVLADRIVSRVIDGGPPPAQVLRLIPEEGSPTGRLIGRSADPAPREIVIDDTSTWVVRHQGTGEVVGEMSLSQALELLSTRR